MNKNNTEGKITPILKGNFWKTVFHDFRNNHTGILVAGIGLMAFCLIVLHVQNKYPYVEKAEPVTSSDSTILSETNKQKKVVLNKKNLSLKRGKKFGLKLKHTRKKVKWSSSNKSIVSVSKKGVVTAKKRGKAKITASIKKKKYVCKVTVQ